jgi:hypothetical protein
LHDCTKVLAFPFRDFSSKMMSRVHDHSQRF